MINQKTGASLWVVGMTSPIAANEIQKTDIIPGFTAHAAEYALLTSMAVGMLGVVVMGVIGVLNLLEQRRSNRQDEKETERHNRAEEEKD